MNAATIIGAVNAATKALSAAAQLAEAVRPVAEQFATVATASDAAAINQALTELQGQNDALHTRVSDKLEAASKL